MRLNFSIYFSENRDMEQINDELGIFSFSKKIVILLKIKIRQTCYQFKSEFTYYKRIEQR